MNKELDLDKIICAKCPYNDRSDYALSYPYSTIHCMKLNMDLDTAMINKMGGRYDKCPLYKEE